MYDEDLYTLDTNDTSIDPYETLNGIDVCNPSEDDTSLMLESIMQGVLVNVFRQSERLRQITQLWKSKETSTSGNNLTPKNKKKRGKENEKSQECKDCEEHNR